MTFTIPIKIVSVANLREHWAAKAKRAKGHRAAASLIGRVNHIANVKMPCVVKLIRIAPRPLDTDNLASAFKATRDGLADAMNITDNDPRVTWEYTQERGKPKEYSARIEVR